MQWCKLKADDLSDLVVSRLNETSLFTSVGFARLWNDARGKDVYWAAQENERTLAVLPGVEFGRGRLGRFQAMPDGCYGRIVFVEPIPDRRAIYAGVAEALKKAGYARVHLYDYYRQFDPASSGFNRRRCRTGLVDISSPDWQPPDKKLLSEIRKAEREGVKVVGFDAEKHFDAFIALMHRTETRHGRKPKYAPAFFRALAALARLDSRVRWVVVEHQGRLAASHIYFVDGEMALNWQVYFDKAFSFLKPNQFIMFTVARELAGVGVRQLNQGASPSDAEGLGVYKQKWGSEEYDYDCLELTSWLGRLR